MRNKVAVIGAGNVGSEAARYLAYNDIADVALVDIKEGLAEGKALDLSQAAYINRFSARVYGSTGYNIIEGSDVVIVTAGVPRKPGMSRDDLIEINLKIIKQVAENLKKYAPDAFVIVVTNPLDAMTYAMYKLLGVPKNKVMGQAGVLDSARLSFFVAEKLGVSPADVNGMVLGTHGDTMVPLPRFTTVNGVPITELLDKETIDQLVERTKFGGGEIVKLMGTSAWFAPGSAAALMAEAILKDSKRVLPVTTLAEGQYGINGIFIGLPVILGGNGVEKIIELPLNDEEKALLKKAEEHVRKLHETVDRLL